MKKKHLEIILQKVPQPNHPTPTLEQYMTPASIASDIIFNAYHLGDINDKIIVDLGCGTGIFSIGAALLGAKKITGIDVDKECIYLAKNYAEQNNLEIEFKIKNVSDVEIKCNTVLMNPPFGAQKSNQKADRRFIEKGFEIGEIIYSLHLTKTIPFLEEMISSLDGIITHQRKYSFPIKWQFEFHKKEVKEFNVSLLRIKTR
jgi:putative methylase